MSILVNRGNVSIPKLVIKRIDTTQLRLRHDGAPVSERGNQFRGGASEESEYVLETGWCLRTGFRSRIASSFLDLAFVRRKMRQIVLERAVSTLAKKVIVEAGRKTQHDRR